MTSTQTKEINWPYVRLTVARIALRTWFLLSSSGLILYYVQHPGRIWSDAHIYYRASEAWMSGGNPWDASWSGIRYGAPPPSLLLNLPLIPFGESFAVAFWVAVNTAAILFLFRRFRLPWYWIAFYPISEGFLAATPDVLLAAIVVVGAGGIAAAAKPYSIPALVAERRWVALAIGATIVVATFPLLPWTTFFSTRDLITSSVAQWSRPVSAWGEPLAIVGVLIAFLLIGWRRSAMLATPALWPFPQPHYALFSMPLITTSTVLAVTMTTTNPQSFAHAVIVYALWERRDLVRDVLRVRPRSLRARVEAPGG